MYLLTPITEKCGCFFEWSIPPEMRRGEQVCIDFKSFHEVIDALAAEGLKPEEDFIIE